MTANTLSHIERQVSEAEEDLRAYPPDAVDWVERSYTAVRTLVPWLIDTAPGLARFVEEVLNSPRTVREAWAKIRAAYDIGDQDLALLDSQLRRQDILHNFTGGNVISKLIEHHLIDHFPDRAMKSNGSSDYPDLYITSFDYTALPVFTRSIDTFGAARKGKKQRPVRMPDGLEIKTCRGAVRVDCHYPHMGTHLILQHRTTRGKVRVEDVLIAFLRKDHYHQSSRSTEATTVKHSFNGEAFISLLHSHEENLTSLPFGS